MAADKQKEQKDEQIEQKEEEMVDTSTAEAGQEQDGIVIYMIMLTCPLNIYFGDNCIKNVYLGRFSVGYSWKFWVTATHKRSHKT